MLLLESVNSLQQQAFWSKVSIKDPQSCWEWSGAKKPSGYGNVRINKKYLLAHRVAFVLASKIEIPQGMLVCHVCDNPSCCNPNHLMLGTVKSNAADMILKGRAKKPGTAARGANNGNSKLSPEKVLRIRSLYGTNQKNQYELAEMFGVTQTNIGNIINNKTWRHV